MKKTVKQRIISLLLMAAMLVTMVPAMAAPYSQEAEAIASADTPTVSVINPRIESVENPIGMDVEIPFFSWALESDARGVVQESYRILVAPTQAALEVGNLALVWDSGVVNSNNTIGVRYKGDPVEARTRYYWRVISETNIGTAIWDQTAFWETGLLDDSHDPWDDVGAHWITAPVGEPWQDIYNYTIEYDFQIYNHCAGFAFGGTSGSSTLFMTQFNINPNDQGGNPAAVVPMYRPHAWGTTHGGGIGRTNREISYIIEPEHWNRGTWDTNVWFTCRIEVTTMGNISQIRVWLGPVGEPLQPVSANNGTGAQVVEEVQAWALRRIGFRQTSNTSNGTWERADFTNVQVWDNTTTLPDDNSDLNRVFFADFSDASEDEGLDMWLNPDIRTAENAEPFNYMRVEPPTPATNDRFYWSVRNVMEPAPQNEPLFRRSFTVQTHSPVAHARLYATARGYYEFSLNGEKWATDSLHRNGRIISTIFSTRLMM
ncbi:MAG: hypothetical protein FWE28_10235 [Oscillospiraceae bacterium]|nr:hypothetical protein [Oscillospiraceae bacterium]